MTEKWPLTPVATARLVMESAERRCEEAKAAFYRAPLVRQNRTDFASARAHSVWALNQLFLAEERAAR